MCKVHKRLVIPVTNGFGKPLMPLFLRGKYGAKVELKQLEECAVGLAVGVEEDNHALVGSRCVPQLVLLHHSNQGEQIVIQVVKPVLR